MTGCRCTVATCNNSLEKTRKGGQNVSYLNFPKNPEIRAIWMQKCRREGKWNYGSCRVCSVHFTEHDYGRMLSLNSARTVHPTNKRKKNLLKAFYCKSASIQKHQRNRYR
ncbi:hypothetical protein RI129_007804 [Pyrocoelia pectoralis]|uniref:THAP-type domain-containing protein n=1 Tax=Pyrocoelia pectoralis TaxID=417401 RepID=A0AAN7VD11_9COLE